MQESAGDTGLHSSIAFVAPKKFNQISEASGDARSDASSPDGQKFFQDTQRQDGEFNIDLEEVGAASKANSETSGEKQMQKDI
mmetsp:Transcript_40522/g.53154  ORF Transcript_40522/g.53154 Transcript_40522/m.53154 type:complete len:83 (-) Transcript_40522:3325-3573(-)|eukprot:CAMPEP_0170452630 /NCGR_PEP_ID=MMETSP0123-20130129/1459_1 /TAXON_ID=182087 /ORGANISM="Favella ehrenbergii, Strain Fehren 1" /LENGTH=82 /DNA_ID=CAMNT_0010714689 /DNA_START=646 /DNA_END=894 /DNA_ORIENTATION=+